LTPLGPSGLLGKQNTAILRSNSGSRSGTLKLVEFLDVVVGNPVLIALQNGAMRFMVPVSKGGRVRQANYFEGPRMQSKNLLAFSRLTWRKGFLGPGPQRNLKELSAS